MDAQEAVERLRAAPSYATFAELDIPPSVVSEIEVLPECQELVVDGRRKRLTSPEVNERLDVYLDLLRESLRAMVSPGGEPVPRRELAATAGLSYSVIKERKSPRSETFDEAFAAKANAIEAEIVDDTGDRFTWIVNQPAEELAKKGWDIKQANPLAQYNRLRHDDFKDTMRVEGKMNHEHMHVHAQLSDELTEISARFQRPAKAIPA